LKKAEVWNDTKNRQEMNKLKVEMQQSISHFASVDWHHESNINSAKKRQDCNCPFHQQTFEALTMVACITRLAS
jgi:hypothetical protein